MSEVIAFELNYRCQRVSFSICFNNYLPLEMMRNLNQKGKALLKRDLVQLLLDNSPIRITDFDKYEIEIEIGEKAIAFQKQKVCNELV